MKPENVLVFFKRASGREARTTNESFAIVEQYRDLRAARDARREPAR
ncbi:MAG: hypothetical protein ACRD15_07710 [Vicinamibacterales bacterium]